MKKLVLKTIRSHYGQPWWPRDDFVVLDAGIVVGRIMLHPQAPKELPWFWTITAVEAPPSTHNRGHAATRERAMADFKARWPR